MQLSEGQLLADRYELRRRLGAGGAGAVFAAYDRQQSKEVAVKVLWPEFFEADGGETRFRDEIELAASLNHPGIVQVLEGQTEGAVHFVAMELLENPTLRQRMDALAGAGQGFTVDEVVHVGVALTEALGYAHQKMVHGAVKPENIFLGDDGTVTLTDFGMALLRQVRGTKRTGTSLDIAPYLAPEQLRGAQEVDPSADQYATAAVLYEMLTGEVPAGRWKPAHQRRPDTPRRFSRALDRALSSATGERFADMGAFATALGRRPDGQGGRRKLWAVTAMILLLAAAGASFPQWRGPVAATIRYLLRDEEAQASAKAARAEALVAAASWRKVAELLPDKPSPDRTTAANEALADGNRHLEEMTYDEAEQCFRRATEMYKSQLATAMRRLRDEPAKVAETARDLNEQLDALRRSLVDRIAEATGHLEACIQNLRTARADEDREAIEIRRRAAEVELNLLNRLSSLTEANVFSSSVRAEIAAGFDQAYQELEAARYAEALMSFARLQSRLEALHGWPDQAERALRQQLTLAQEIEQVRSALGPMARELAAVKSLVGDTAGHMDQGNDELSAGRVREANASYESAQECLSKVQVQAVTGLFALAQAYDRERKNSAAVLALNELLTWDPKHAAGQELRRKILSCRVVNSIGMELVFIPPGAFLMGSPGHELGRDEDEHQRRVRFDTGFFLGTTEVTQAQWSAVMGHNPSERKGDDLPVEQVTWEEATEFCQRLSDKEGRPYRLPTEVEWEYACRAGTTSPFSFGETISTDQANFDGVRPYRNGAEGVFRNETTPVGSFPANAWGLYDMHGNVWEWCGDVEESEAAPPVNESTEAAPKEAHVLRGGSWRNRPQYCRSANRVLDLEGSRLGNIGFRVVLESD